MHFKLIAIFVMSQSFTALALNASDYRLPKYIKPISYEIVLTTVDPSIDTFGGKVIITFDWSDSNDTTTVNRTIRLHASPKYIAMTSIKLGKNTTCTSTQDSTTEIATIICQEAFTTDNVLTIIYNGTFSTSDMLGFYKTSYTDGNETKTLVATQFEPTYARRAFPCFDEPEFKATFKVGIKYPNKYTAMSNTRLVNKQYGTKTNTTTVQFAFTPKMSPHLIAFMVSEFEEPKDANLNKSYTFGVNVRSDAQDYVTTAKSYGPKLLDLLGNWTGLPYNILGNAKIDLVAIPDFSAETVENWGLLTYKEEDLLDEGDSTSALVKQNVITVIAHELTHQWFGGYVTLNWWSDTWLNEGFAEYFQYHIPNELIYENMELDKQFVTLVQQSAMQVDSDASSQPLSSEESSVYTPTQNVNKFASISYSKGSSIIRMIKYILGEDNFQTGLRSYLKNNNYSNVDVDNLLTELQTVVPDKNVNLTEYLNTWIYEQGFPLVTVSLNNSNSTVKIEATKQFLTTNQTGSNTSWYVPISYTTANQLDFDNFHMEWLTPENKMLVVNGATNWIIVNLQSSGFYRVNYDDTLWSRIITALKNKDEFKKIHVLNRAQLVDDIFNIATTGDVNYTLAFELVEYLKLETEYYPWYSALTAFRSILDKMSDPTLLQTKILNWMEHIVEVPSSKTPVSNLTHVDTLKRTLILEWACKFGHSDCVKYVQDKFSDYQKDRSSMTDYNLRNIIFCNGLRYSKNASEDFEFLFNIYENSKSPNEKISLLTSLGCVEDATVLEKYLKCTIADNSPIKKQYIAKVFAAVYSSSTVGVKASLKFLETHITKMALAYKGTSALSDIILGVAHKLSSKDQVDRLKSVISYNLKIEEIALVQKQAESIAESNLQWVETYSNHIQTLLEPIEATNEATNEAISNKVNTNLAVILCYILIKIISYTY